MTALLRSVLRFQPATQDRLDALAELASGVLHCEVPRAAVVRAAVGAWLTSSESGDPAHLIEAIRASQLKRGRKPKQQPSPRATVGAVEKDG
jgi:hypothetical protein